MTHPTDAARARTTRAFVLSLVASASWLGCGDDALPEDASMHDGGAPDVDAGNPDGGAPDAGADGGPPLPASLDELLATTEGLDVVVERAASPSGARAFELTLSQPVDHAEPAGARFAQRAVLIARSDETQRSPLVLVINGYALNEGLRDRVELTELVDGSQLAIEYRYNGGSTTESDPTFQHLTVVNGAADVHRWVEALRPFFTGPLLSTGFSRGGMAALEHRALHEGDVHATVGVGVPDIDGVPDARWASGLRRVGPPACHEALEQLQRDLLASRRAALVARLGADGTRRFTRIGGPERALEAMAQTLAMAFWQAYGDDRSSCDTLPDGATASEDELLRLLRVTDLLWLGSDEGQQYVGPYYFLAARETGVPQLPVDHLADLLTTGAPTLERGTLPPGLPPPRFDGAVDALVDEWVERRAERIVFIHGGLDGWSAWRHPAAPDREVLDYEAPGVGHYGTSVAALSDADRAAVTERVRAWARPPAP